MQKITRLFLLASVLVFGVIYLNLLLAGEMFTHDAIVWYGSYHYFVESLSRGVIPLWDPYTISGTPFYQNIPHVGDLDPIVLLCAIAVKLGMTPLTTFIYMHLSRLLVFAFGAYYLFKFITGCRASSAVAACVLFFSMMPGNLREQTVFLAFLSPFAVYFLLRFFNDAEPYKKYLYLFLFALTTGITFNVFIPAYFLLNIIVFFFAAALLKLIDVKKTVASLRFRLIPLSIIFIMLVAAIAAPSLATYSDSRSAGSELFPSVRILQKNASVYKELMASDIGSDALSQRFTNNRGVYSSWGNLLSLAYPDLWKAYFQKFNALKAYDFISETFQYIGIIPFIIALIGLLYSKSRWRILALVMLVVISINMISWEGVHNKAPNILQEAFNTIFPFLRMIEVRETFSGFFLLWLCLLLSLGLRIFFDSVNFKAFVDMRLRALLLLPAVLIAGKVILTYMYLRPSLYLSMVDVMAFIVIGIFAVLIYLYQQKMLAHARLCAILLVITLVDIGYYNLSMKPYVLAPNTLAPALEANLNTDGDFAYLRTPFVLAPLAFSEPMFKVKGAMSRGNKHHLFTTKRYYDYFTHLPLEKQLVLSGVDTPIIRFFSETDARIFKGKSDVLTYMSDANEEELRNSLLIEEAVDNGAQGGNTGNGLVFTGLGQFPDRPDLNTQNIITVYNNHMVRNASRAKDVADNPKKHLTTDESAIVVKDFSPNSLTVDVNNAVDGYLYYNDGYSKYWNAYDNGKETLINIANYNFKAVFLPKGEHRVVFIYNPWRYKVGLLAYAAGLFISVILAAFFFFKSRGKTKRVGPEESV